MAKKVTQGQFFKNTYLSQNDAHILQIISTNAQLAAASRFSKKAFLHFEFFLINIASIPREIKLNNQSLSKLSKVSDFFSHACLPSEHFPHAPDPKPRLKRPGSQ